MKILTSFPLTSCIACTTLALLFAACDRSDADAEKIIIDLQTGERLSELPADVTGTTPEEVQLDPAEAADLRTRQEQQLVESVAVMRQLSRTLSGITDARTLEDARPRLEELGAKIKRITDNAEDLGEVPPDLEETYSPQLAEAKLALDETWGLIQANADIWQDFQTIMDPFMGPGAAQK